MKIRELERELNEKNGSIERNRWEIARKKKDREKKEVRKIREREGGREREREKERERERYELNEKNGSIERNRWEIAKKKKNRAKKEVRKR